MRFADFRDALQPAEAGHVDAALALHGFDDRRGRVVETAAGVGEHALQQVGTVPGPAEVAIERQARGVAERHPRAVALETVAGSGERAQGHPVESLGKGDDGAPPRRLARQLERRFHRIGAGRPGKLHLVVEAARTEDDLVQGAQQAGLRRGRHVEAVQHPVAGHVLHQALLHLRVVVPVVEHPGAGEEVDIPPSLLVPQQRPRAAGEHRREVAAVDADLGLHALEQPHVGQLARPARADRTDAQQHLGLVRLALREDGLGEGHLLLDRRLQVAGQLLEQPHRGLVAGRDRRLDPRDPVAGRAVQKPVQHREAEAAAAEGGVHADLPDEQDVGRLRRHVGEHHAGQPFARIGHDAGVGERAAEHQVAVGRVLGQGAGGAHQAPDRLAVFHRGLPVDDASDLALLGRHRKCPRVLNTIACGELAHGRPTKG